MNKRYWLFAGEIYYPGGGLRDLVGTFDTLEEAHEKLFAMGKTAPLYDWGHIYDSHDKLVVEDINQNRPGCGKWTVLDGKVALVWEQTGTTRTSV